MDTLTTAIKDAQLVFGVLEAVLHLLGPYSIARGAWKLLVRCPRK